MTEKQNSGFFSSFVSQNRYPAVSQSAMDISPYLNFDPSILQTNSSQFILPEGQLEQRGRLELMFLTIGGAVLLGGTIGGLNGFYQGLINSKTAKSSLKQTLVLNYVTKQSTMGASSLGSIALLYSIFGVCAGKLRGVEDELNTVAAGTMTGLLYRLPHGLRAAAGGGLVGFTCTSIYALYCLKDKLFS